MKRILACMIAGILCTLSLTGCEVPGDKSKKDAVTDVLLYDFEDYDRSFLPLKVMSYFGAVDVNEDEQYVKSGSRSALLRPLGYHSTMVNNTYTRIKAESCLYLPLTSGIYEFDYSDSARIQEVEFALYNAEETEVAVYVGMIYEKNAVTVSEPVKFMLKPGWNDVFYVLDHNVLAIDHNLQACYGIALSFDRANSRELKDAPRLYLDDVRLKVSETAVTPENIVTLVGKEVCDFEELYQKYAVGCNFYDKAFRPEISVVSAEEYGLTAPSGRRVLRVSLKPVDCIDGTIYDGIYLKQAMIDAVNFGSLSDSDKLCFEIYNDSDEPMDFALSFHTTNDSGYAVCHRYVGPKQWASFQIRMDAIDALWGNGENTYRNNPGEIYLEWAEFTGEERVLYLDDFRIE